MDWQTAFNVLMILCGALGGYVLKSFGDTMKSLQGADRDLTVKVQAIEVLVAGQYVTRDGLDKTISAVFDYLRRIEEKIDKKADK